MKADVSFAGVQLLLPASLADSPLRQLLNPALPCSLYQSALHHPNAILFHRTSHLLKVKNPDFVSRTQRTVVILLDKKDLEKEGTVEDLERHVGMYKRAGAHVTVFFQRAEELVAVQEYLTQGKTPAREQVDEWEIRLLLLKVSVFEPENERESAKLIGKIALCLLSGATSAPSSVYEDSADRVEGAGPWLNFLANIPGVSQTKAQQIIQKYPSLPDLMQEYGRKDLSEATKSALLEDLGDGKRHKVLSARIYRLMSSRDPSALYVG